MNLNDRQILYSSTNHAWSYGWTFYQMLAQALARDNDVVYVDTPRSVARGRLPRTRVRPTDRPRLRVLQTPAVPLQRIEAVRRAAAFATAFLVERWARSARFDPDLVWTYAPYELELARRFPRARLVYWTGDEVVIPREELLLEGSAAILCVSEPVYERHRARYGERAHFVPVACDYERYATAHGAAPELVRLPRPIAGYSGWVNERVDYELVRELAQRLRGTVVLAGPVRNVQPAELNSLRAAGVRVLGPQPAGRVPDIVCSFDVALLPLLDNEFNRNSNPAKFYEYLAAGRSVVATDVPTLRRFDGVASVGDRASFVDRALAAAAFEDGDVHARRRVAREHSFDALLERLRAVPL
jgi:glycosyltransferase involved in cell wall biosynthesis